MKEQESRRWRRLNDALSCGGARSRSVRRSVRRTPAVILTTTWLCSRSARHGIVFAPVWFSSIYPCLFAGESVDQTTHNASIDQTTRNASVDPPAGNVCMTSHKMVWSVTRVLALYKNVYSALARHTATHCLFRGVRQTILLP